MAASPLQGVYRIVSATYADGPVFTCATHLVFSGRAYREVEDGKVLYDDDTRVESTFTLETKATPWRLTVSHRWLAPDGKVVGTTEQRACCGLRGTTLRIAWADDMGEGFPTSLKDESATHVLCRRERSAAVTARLLEPPRLSKRESWTHPELGSLRWDESLRWWQGCPKWHGKKSIELFLRVARTATGREFDKAAATLRELRRRQTEIVEFVTAKLLRICNQHWREGCRPISEQSFARRLAVASVTIEEDRAVDIYMADGGLFDGHVVIASLDKKLAPKRVELAG